MRFLEIPRQYLKWNRTKVINIEHITRIYIDNSAGRYIILEVDGRKECKLFKDREDVDQLSLYLTDEIKRLPRGTTSLRALMLEYTMQRTKYNKKYGGITKMNFVKSLEDNTIREKFRWCEEEIGVLQDSMAEVRHALYELREQDKRKNKDDLIPCINDTSSSSIFGVSPHSIAYAVGKPIIELKCKEEEQNKIFRHFQGGIYVVIDNCINTLGNEDIFSVIYRDINTGDIFVTSSFAFYNDIIESKTKRFTKLIFKQRDGEYATFQSE